jgi:hypothetical protein
MGGGESNKDSDSAGRSGIFRGRDCPSTWSAWECGDGLWRRWRKCFIADFTKEVMRLIGVDHRTTTPYHPQANGLVERPICYRCTSISSTPTGMGYCHTLHSLKILADDGKIAIFSDLCSRGKITSGCDDGSGNDEGTYGFRNHG